MEINKEQTLSGGRGDEVRAKLHEEIIKKLDYQPSGLTNYERENPLKAIADFFDNYELHYIRDRIWQFYKGWVNYSSDFSDGKEITDMLFFYTQLIDFLNVTYLYVEKKRLEV